MKRIFSIAITLIVCCHASFGWGRVGHATIATIAEDHLTPEAKAIVADYLKGDSMAKYASYADKYKTQLLVDIGFDPTEGSRVTTYPHTFEADMKAVPFEGINDNGRFVKNCVHFINKMADELKDHKNLSDSLRFHHIVMITHFVGDMHCPEHIRYYPDDMSIGKYDITYDGQKTTMHKIWDSGVIATVHPEKTPREVADAIDNCSKKEIAKIAAGTTYDWAADCAETSLLFQNLYPDYRASDLSEACRFCDAVPDAESYTPVSERLQDNLRFLRKGALCKSSAQSNRTA